MKKLQKKILLKFCNLKFCNLKFMQPQQIFILFSLPEKRMELKSTCDHIKVVVVWAIEANNVLLDQISEQGQIEPEILEQLASLDLAHREHVDHIELVDEELHRAPRVRQLLGDVHFLQVDHCELLRAIGWFSVEFSQSQLTQRVDMLESSKASLVHSLVALE